MTSRQIQITDVTPEAPYLLYDNFPGAPSALNGKAPVTGNGAGTYQVTGAQLANAMSGNGNAMLNVASGNAYVQYQCASAPGEIGFAFELAQANGAATPTAANYGALYTQVANFSGFHPQVTTTAFSNLWFNNGVSTAPAFVDQQQYAALALNTIYTVRIFLEYPYAHMFLFDPSGAQIGYSIVNDSNLVSVTGGGTWVFFQLFDGATNLVPFGVTYHSWWARAKQAQSLSQNYYRGGLDQTPIGLRTPQPVRASSIFVGKSGNPSGAFSVNYNSSLGDAPPTISDVNPSPSDSIFKLRTPGAAGGSHYDFSNAAGNTHSLGTLNDTTAYIQDHNNVRWWVRPPFDGTNEYSRYPYTSAGVRIGGAAGPYWYSGAGAPAIDAPIGSLYSNTSGGAATTLYVKTAVGVGGWTAK